MPSIFAYCRVSPSENESDDSLCSIEASGFNIEPECIVFEKIAATVAPNERPEFLKLLRRLEAEDLLVVTKLDGLGRSANEVQGTVERLDKSGVRVHCLALAGDLTSAAGKATMSVIAAVAAFERDLLVERTKAGMARAKQEGKHMGRPPALSEVERSEVLQRLAAGEAISRIARKLKISRTTIGRIREKAARET